jgi:periplasmic protein TonB
MELLMDTAGTPSTGTPSKDVSVGGRAGVPARRGLSLASGVSIAVHGALVAAALALPAYRPADDAQVTELDVIAEPIVPPLAPVEPPPQPAVVRPVVTRRARSFEAPVPMPAAVPPPEEQPVAEPAPPVASAPTAEVSQDPRAVLVATAPVGAGVSGGGAGVSGGRGPAGVASESQRRNLAERYRDELIRTRIRDHFRYPAEARELELTGRVIVQVTVDRNGRLLAARLAGSCPHPLLCEDGLRTVRASAPFPALPADLGDSLRIEIPLKYDFQ